MVIRSNTRLLPRTFGGLVLTGMAVATVASTGHAAARAGSGKPAKKVDTQKVFSRYGKTPLTFEENRGQTDRQVKFLTRGSGYNVFLTPQEAVLSLQRMPGLQRDGGLAATKPPVPSAADRSVLRLRLKGSNASAKVSGVKRSASVSNYLTGRGNQLGVPHYARVRYEAVYPGIDLDYYGNQRKLEYDFRVQPGADAGQIRLEVGGAEKLSLDASGNLLLQTANGTVRQDRPVSYQVVNGKQVAVASKFTLLADNQVGFKLGRYDATRPLVIDPVLTWATFLGGSDVDEGNGIAVDEDGNAYVTGSTLSPDFPFVDGSYSVDPAGLTDAFVAKLNTDGTQLIYCTFIGGSGHDAGTAIALDPDNNAYITGFTSSSDFPVQGGFEAPPVQSTYKGGGSDAIVVKLDKDGAGLIYSTYLGGTGEKEGADIGYGIDVDPAGGAYIVGTTGSLFFPSKNAVQPTWGGGPSEAFVTRLDNLGQLDFSSFIGGGPANYNGNTDYGDGIDVAYGVAVDPAGNVYVAGATGSKNLQMFGVNYQRVNRSVGKNTQEGFLCKIYQGGKNYAYTTYLGGSASEAIRAIDVDDAGNAYITGVTRSPNFPVKNPLYGSQRGYSDAFVGKFNAVGSDFVWCTYLGGTKNDEGRDIAVDPDGNVFLTGGTQSEDFPMARPLKGVFGGLFDTFLTKISTDGRQILYCCYFGSNAVDFGNSLAVDRFGDVYITGYTEASGFPVTEGVVQPTFGGGFRDAYVAKIHDDLEIDVRGKLKVQTSLDFGSRFMGTTITRFITLRNVGAGKSLAGTVGTLDAPFKCDVSGGSFLLEPSRKMNLRITFKPDRQGPFNAKLIITSTDPKKQQVVIKIKGRGKLNP